MGHGSKSGAQGYQEVRLRLAAADGLGIRRVRARAREPVNSGISRMSLRKDQMITYGD
jgi:hypothetical protein